MGIEFSSETGVTRFYDPRDDFEEASFSVEFREDPLTGWTSRIVPSNFYRTEDPEIEEYVTDDENCVFCRPTVEEVTPKYPDYVGYERGSVGEAISFPNLTPSGKYMNVVVLTEQHSIPLDELAPETFANGFQAAIDYVLSVFQHDDTATQASVNMNFLPPAGSSIVHPHIQTLVGDRRTRVHEERFNAARAYYDSNGRSYWDDLLDAERGEDRYLGRTGSIEWIAPFAPRHHRQFTGVFDEAGVPDPDSPSIEDLATGITRILSYYAGAGLNTFNFALFLNDDPSIPPIFDIVCRSVFDRYYWSDSAFFTVLHDEGVIDIAPETYVEEASEYF